MASQIVWLNHWIWFIAAALLMVLEVIAPGFFMLFLGLAALLVGVIAQLVDIPWQWQCAAFVVFSAAWFPLWWRLRKQAEEPTDQPFLNRRMAGYVGKVFRLETAIIDGNGTVRIDDTVWRVTGPDAAAGTRVKVERVEGAVLHVTPAQQRS
jgi:membrane protein implicated in regulation of membrane protease activity